MDPCIAGDGVPPGATLGPRLFTFEMPSVQTMTKFKMKIRFVVMQGEKMVHTLEKQDPNKRKSMQGRTIDFSSHKTDPMSVCMHFPEMTHFFVSGRHGHVPPVPHKCRPPCTGRREVVQSCRVFHLRRVKVNV